MKCAFYMHGIEDRDHFFFLCGFISSVWRHVMDLCKVLNPPTNWDDVFYMGLQLWRGKTMKAYLCRMVVLQFTISGET